MNDELIVINKDQGTEIIIYNSKKNQAMIRIGREVKFCDKELINQLKDYIKVPHLYRAEVEKITLVNPIDWISIVDGLQEIEKINKQLRENEDRVLYSFNEILRFLNGASD